MRVDDLPTPALIVDLDAARRQHRPMGPRWPGESAAPPREGVQVDRAGPPGWPTPDTRSFCCATMRRDGGHGRRRPGPRPAAGQRGARRPTRLGVRPRLDARVTVAVDSAETIDAAADGRGARGARRRERRAAPLRVRPEDAGRAGRAGRGGGVSRSAASWATRVTSWARGPRTQRQAASRRSDGRSPRHTRPSAATSSRAAARGTWDLNHVGHRAASRFVPFMDTDVRPGGAARSARRCTLWAP